MRPTRTGIFVRAALRVTGSPGQTAAPVGNATDLPAADDPVQDATGIGEHTSLAERQLPQDVRNKNVIAGEVVRPVSNLRTIHEVIVSVVKRFGPGVMGQELQSLGEALGELHLQGIV